MTQITTIRSEGETPKRAPTRRALAKRQTRLKVLNAARNLFSEEGYEGATIRDIAAAAGMSTGAVFANFRDKSDLFREIMTEDLDALLGAMRAAGTQGGRIEDSLLKVLMAGYGFYKARLQLARAAFSVAWDVDGGPALRGLASSRGFQDVFSEQLTSAVERGELSQQSEVKLRSQMLMDCFLANFSQAIFEGWSLDALQARAKDQIRIVLAGARRG
ncbi:MAG: TetR/AcrR family transcriptional regulator [Alphaproteobacteria bacterium]